MIDDIQAERGQHMGYGGSRTTYGMSLKTKVKFDKYRSDLGYPARNATGSRGGQPYSSKLPW
eukprot:1689660-Pyramimonas_sp.AAC.1